MSEGGLIFVYGLIAIAGLWTISYTLELILKYGFAAGLSFLVMLAGVVYIGGILEYGDVLWGIRSIIGYPSE